MSTKSIHRFFLVVALVVTGFSYAQIQPFFEENNLNFQEHFFEALKQKAINNFGKAVESLEKCYEIDQNNTAVEFELSKNYLELKKYEEAEIFVNRALKKEPKNVYLLQHKEAIYKAKNNLEKAIEIQKEIIKLNPKFSDELVLLYIQNREFEKAGKLILEIEDMALSTTRIKSYKEYLENRKLPVLTSQNNIDTSNEDIETLKKQYKEHKDYKILQQILIKEAESEYFENLYNDSKEALELFPSQSFLYKMNGLALNKLGKYNEAISVLTVGIDFVIDNNKLEADFYEELSISYKGLNNNNEALKYQQKAKELRKEN
ncbi:lipopolysaccharide assembly protein LapB [Lutibacter sp. B1]|uniref:tetratricopeptide repeat protein n=1 Tax=Lutibacter sp. B1 TaxID=2725996 RepID=UPI001457678A|nr:tetratricopeptide repeat protein [Lutibacter sp. B1]NLP57056.1 hypothetical protein [Lutibacter sp. B1]